MQILGNDGVNTQLRMLGYTSTRYSSSLALAGPSKVLAA